MKNSVFLFFVAITLLFQTNTTIAQNIFPYKDSNLNTDKRTQDLLSRMTIEEKVGQLLCPLGWEMYEKSGNEISYSGKYKDLIDNQHVGMFWAVFRADPWTKKTLENGLDPVSAAKAANALQKYAIENTRLGIPIFIAEEAVHGHMAIGTTVFPTGIGMASTWNPSTVAAASRITAKEIRLQGGHIGYGPVLDLSRDPRWSRVEESYGEDPILTGIMGAAAAKGANAGNIRDPHHIISTIKHFVAYGIPEGGHNGNTAVIGHRELHENFLPPFYQTIRAGAQSIMTAYNSVDGIPCTADGYLLTDLLRKEWGFEGFVVSDLGSIDGIMSSHHVAKDLQEAGTIALTAGVDADLGAKPFSLLIEAVKSGKILESAIDTAAYRILKLKFEMGLFEQPYVDEKKAQQVRTQDHIDVALQAARESIVLLENKNHILPLAKNLKNIAVIGPNADMPYNQLGDYTAPQERTNIKTVLDGIRSKLPDSNIQYAKGVAIRDTSDNSIDAAVELAKGADVAIVVVGGSSARDFKTKYIETGAAIATAESLSDMESGEGFDRSTLDLMGHQLSLLKALKETGTPLIVVYVQGRPLNMNWAQKEADALLTAWYPGQQGGVAIADVLFGDYNPAGRLPISVPRSVGQLPVYYNKKTPRGHEYVEETSDPLYHFGYGRSYTSFEYNDLQVNLLPQGDVDISVRITNTGKLDGDEVIQLYVKDDVASTVQPIKQLKKFERIHLKKNGNAIIRFRLTPYDLSVIDRNMQRIMESGTFQILVGSSSEDIRLKEQLTIDTPVKMDLYARDIE